MPQVGDLLLWLTFVYHLVHPSLARETGISISFNIMLKWQDSYMP